MLEIELADGSGRLDLMPNTEIDFELNFNLYDFEHIEGTRSWTFELPKTANNIRLIGKYAFIDSRSNFENQLRIHVNISSDLWKSGLLYFQSENKQVWKVYFAGEAGILKRLFNDRTLKDFDLSSYTSLGNMYDHAKTVATAGPSVYPYTFAEVYLPKADIDESEVPLPFANYLKYNSSTAKWSGFSGAVGSFYWPLIPFPFVKSVLLEISEQLSISFAGDLWDLEEFERLVFFNTKCLNAVDQDTGRASGPPIDEVYLADHVPDIKFSDLLKDIARFFNQTVTYDDRTRTIFFYHRSDLLSSTMDTSFKDKVESISQKYAERRSYSFSSPFREEDVLASNEVSDVDADLTGIEGDEDSIEVETLFNTLPMRHYSGLLDEITPVSTLDLNAKTPKTFMIFSYRRSTRFLGGSPTYDKIPFLRSNTNYTAPVGETKDIYSLQWRGNSGLYAKWWEKYCSGLSLGKVLEIEILLDNFDLINFNPLKRYAIFNYVGLFEKLKGKIGSGKSFLKGQVLKL